VADCERLHGGLLDEPANAVSSLAYVAVGAWVWRHNRVQGGALIATGAGSVAYHGFGGPLAHVLHDGSIAFVAVLVVLAMPRFVANVRTRPARAALPVALLATAVPFQALGRTGGPWCAPERLFQAHGAWHVLTALALGAFFDMARERRDAPDAPDAPGARNEVDQAVRASRGHGPPRRAGRNA
jgi:hypothetical protein